MIMKKYIGFSIIALSMGLVSCDDWLDKLPDNRMELSSAEDISNLLVSAYPEHHPAYLLEMYSDNTDECIDPAWSEADRFQRQAWHWDDITETMQDETPQELWNAHYKAIAAANAAIEFIEKKGTPAEFNEQLGEALLCRAYAAFQLSTIFCNAYNPQTAEAEQGLPYPTATETVVGQTYERGTLAEFYKNIEQDIERGVNLVRSNYSKPKFHFTPDAANAFAARFYLYKGDFAKSIAYASKVLGSNPTAKARDWKYYISLNANRMVRPEAYISSTEKSNLLLQTVYSEWGAVIYGGYQYGDRYAHSYRITWDEDISSDGVWGNAGSVFNTDVWFNSVCADLFHGKIPYEFEYSDLQAGIGFAHAEFSVFNIELLLIERAEAYALSGNLDAAVADYNSLLSVYMKNPRAYTLQQIVSYYNGIDYYTPTEATPKKHFGKPVYSIGQEGSDQEALLQGIMHLRRILTAHEGFRMQDVKRYGITIYRRTMNSNYEITAVTDSLVAGDPRLAIQLPQDVITAGLDGNARTSVGSQEKQEILMGAWTNTLNQ